MPQSLSKIITHLIFSTKDRNPLLTRSIKDRVYAYMAGIIKKCNAMPIAIGGVEDHVHVLCRLSKTQAPCDLVEEIKKSTSRFIKTLAKEHAAFKWQNGYAMLSVSPSQVEDVEAYIRNQETHHKKQTFKDELREVLTKSKIGFDETYIWD